MDYIGKAFGQMGGNFLNLLAQSILKKKQMEEAQGLVGGLLRGSQPQMTQAPDLPNYASELVGIPSLPVSGMQGVQAGRPVMSPENIPALMQLAQSDYGKNALGLLTQMSQRKWQDFTPGSVAMQTDIYGNPTGKSFEVPFKPQTLGTSTDWQDLIENGKTVTGVINGVKTKKQFKNQLNPMTGQWERIFRDERMDANTMTGSPFQLVPTDLGYTAFNRRTNKFEPINGEPTYKLTPTEVKTQKMNLEGNLGSIKSIEEIINRGSLTGPITGTARKIGTRFFNDKDATTLMNRLAQLRTVIYGLSGKQINEAEQDWLKNEILPNMSNPSENFEVTLGEFKNWVTRRLGDIEKQFPGSAMGKPIQNNKPVSEMSTEDLQSELARLKNARRSQ